MSLGFGSTSVESTQPPRQEREVADARPQVGEFRDQQALTWRDAAGVLAASLVLFTISYLRSRHRIFWGDEIVGWTLLRDSSFARLFHSWSNGADSSGLFFFLFARPWLRIFGATEVAARMFATLGVCASLAMVWVAARRYFSLGVVCFCIPFAYLSNPSVIVQLSNARTYGLFLAAVAATSLLFLRAEPGARLSPILLLGTALAHSLLIGSHILGIVYSAFLIGAMVVEDLLSRDVGRGRMRPKLYASALAGWITLFWTWRNLKANIDIGKPYFWTERPHIGEFPLGLVAYGGPLLFLSCVLACILAACYLLRRGREPLAGVTRRPLYFLGGTFFCIALFLFLKSFLGNSVFIPRYLLPMLIPSALLLCDLMSRILRLFPRPRYGWILPVLGVVVLGLFCRRADPFERGGEDYTAALVQKIPPGVPAVITDVSIFGEVEHYQGSRAMLEAEIDMPFSLNPTRGPRDVVSANMLTIWRRLGYFPGHILPAAQILEQPEFVVVSRESFPLWFEERIAGKPEFKVTDLGRAGGNLHVLHLWLVRRSAAPAKL